MRFDWKEQRLKDFVEINPYSRLPKGAVAKKVSMDKLQPNCRDIPSFELAAYMGGAKFQNGDTLMARITPCLENGKIAQVNILDGNEVGFGSTEYIVFRAKDGISDKDFVYSLVCSSLVREPAIKSMVGSSNRQRVQTDVVENLLISLPPLVEQKKIGELLRSFDDKIRINNAINHNLQQQAIALYQNAFPYGVDDILPDGWRIATIGEIFNLHDSKRIPLSGGERDRMTKKVFPYYGATSLMDYVDDYLFDGIYLLLGEDGTVIDAGGFPVLQYVWGKFWVNNHAHIITGKRGYTTESLWVLFKQTSVRSIVTGAVQPKISQANLKSIQIVLPPIEQLNAYNEHIQPMFATIRNNQDENSRLSALRDTLLPKLMSGEIDVSKVEI